MEIDEVVRPRQQLAPFVDNTARTKCTVCCGANTAAWVFAVLTCVQLPISVALFSRRVVCATWWSILDHSVIVSLPVSLMAFTHQMLLSEALWSKNRKTVFECNIEATAINIGLWSASIASCTLVSRRWLASKSHSYRMLQWEYHRKTRSAANKFVPSGFGRVSVDLDWYSICAYGSLYHTLWGGMIIFLEKFQGAHYAMLYRDSTFSKRCSPRWREWREHVVREQIDKEQKVLQGRWSNTVKADRWRARGTD